MAARDAGGFLQRELRGLAAPLAFFLPAFNLLALTADLGGNPASFSYAAACASALVCAKAVLIADHRLFFNRYPQRPLVWNVGSKTLLYTAVSAAIRLLEHGIRGWLDDGRTLGAGADLIFSQFSWSHFVVVQLWLLALFLVYTAFGELAGAIGRERIMRMFFGPAEASLA